MAFWRFDEKGAVLYYDAWLPNLAPYTSRLYGRMQNASTDAAVIQQLCSSTKPLCQGPNQQYPSQPACQAQLGARPFGSWDEVWGDNVICRTLHVMLARFRPEVGVPDGLSVAWSNRLTLRAGPLPSCRTDRRREVRGRGLQLRLL